MMILVEEVEGDHDFDGNNDKNSLTLMIIIEIVLMSIIIITCNIKYDVDYENYYYTIEGIQRKVKVKISLTPPNHIYQVRCQRLCGGAPPTA